MIDLYIYLIYKKMNINKIQIISLKFDFAFIKN
jgi:hypothetical protein